MVVPGFSGSLTHNRDLVDALASRGYDTFTFSQPRRGTKSKQSILDRKKDTILTILETMFNDDEKIYGVAHSFGSAALLKAARDTPNQFIELILMQPPGVVGRQDFPELVQRVGEKMIKNNAKTIHKRHLSKLIGNPPTSVHAPLPATTRKMIYAQLSSAYTIIKNPRLALSEALAAIRYDIADDAAKTEGSGVQVHIIKAPNDELFSIEEDGLDHQKVMNSSGAFISIADRHAPHDTFWMHPKRTADIIDALIRAHSKAN